ncbi:MULTISPECIES: DUF202 domain-containing protein [Streptomyces]|uniref:DUF202 domain-containing protein n=2 Tax=Streptomyces rimosus subsp. rimosus TaxID=132474 RepID=L8ERA0_STRR1|nr:MULTISPECIES: DUF202 domain-containing protein [Streptomyces]MYT42927.1 DUF202 domain-containing protein [Streptomyces sp. SID5471]QST80143.1 DUF202 domain-containing protein [Streptomyces rimosus subsp. rimosus ATCC 10970]KEF04969.1 hypothetical protein DF17_20590 [Streptomyces rimosus]QDA07822.1 DUF202 domain-containing protein [Streptomyces rimosus]QEV79101.1 DUF202 domain-containing protein [Streptomyces rimosus]
MAGSPRRNQARQDEPRRDQTRPDQPGRDQLRRDQPRHGRPCPDRDPGLQPERTRLAWRRTTLSCTAVAILAGRQVVQHRDPGPVVIVAVALVLLVWIAFVAAAHVRMRAMYAGRPPVLSARTALALVSCTCALAVLGAAILI